VEVCSRPVPAKNTEDGVRAVIKDKPIDPASVEKYLTGNFGEDLPAVRGAMEHLAAALDADGLETESMGLYERFRPDIPKGRRGWGAKGELDLDFIRSLTQDI